MAKTIKGTAGPGAPGPIAAATPVTPAVDKSGKDAKEKKPAARKPKLVRDSFTFPEADYARIGALKQRAMAAGREVKKSEVLRAGLVALSALSDAALLETLDSVDKLKPGRPAR